MSPRGHLLAWLWAALWLRWRLAAVKARRMLEGAPVAGGPPGYHLAPADVPVEGIDYDVEELPAELLARLEDTRVELVDRARGASAPPTRQRGPRRRRGFSLVVVALATFVVLGAGATALVTGTTGVPEVDRWLGLRDAKSPQPQSPDRFGPGGWDTRPQPSHAGSSLEVPLRSGSPPLISASYVARSGDICTAVIDSAGRRDTGDITCVTPGFLRARVQPGRGVVVGAFNEGDQLIVLGFVTGTAEEISVRGPAGSLNVRLGWSWAPKIRGVDSLKPFVALGDAKPPPLMLGRYVIETGPGSRGNTKNRP